MQRRRLLQGIATLPLLTSRIRVFAAPAASPRFLLVFLRGGYDCANALVPYASDYYYEARPTIAIAKPDESVPSGALALNADWALAPALLDSFGTMYASKQAACVPFAGTQDLSRSHFETQDYIERGQPEPRGDVISGFLGRLCSTLTGLAPIAFSNAMPRVFEGGRDVASVSLRNAPGAGFDRRQAEILVQMYAGSPLQGAVAQGLDLREQVAKELADEMQHSGRGAPNAQGFETEARRMARLMSQRYRLGFVDVGQWDTHVNQGGAQGALANNLTMLGRGLAAFAEELGDEWKNTVVVVISEFGRTFRENGNRGTDHGHGSVYWVLGGGINGGRIVGEQIRIQQSTLFQDRDFPVLNDYRAVLAGLFQRLWGLSAAQIQTVFPQAQALDLRLI